MKNIRVVASVGLLLGLVVAACNSTPVENAERTAACKDSGNQKMCGQCCTTKAAKWESKGMTSTCTCFGDIEK